MQNMSVTFLCWKKTLQRGAALQQWRDQLKKVVRKSALHMYCTWVVFALLLHVHAVQNFFASARPNVLIPLLQKYPFPKKFNSKKITSYVFNIRCFSRLLKSKLHRGTRVSSSCDVVWNRAVELVWYYLKRTSGQRNFHQCVYYSWTFYVYVFALADAKPSWLGIAFL